MDTKPVTFSWSPTAQSKFQFTDLLVVMDQLFPAMVVERLLIYGEAICNFPEEGSKKSSRKLGYAECMIFVPVTPWRLLQAPRD